MKQKVSNLYIKEIQIKGVYWRIIFNRFDEDTTEVLQNNKCLCANIGTIQMGLTQSVFGPFQPNLDTVEVFQCTINGSRHHFATAAQ